jgi:hypothetical protein
MEAGSDPLADELARELLEARLIANLATFNSDGSIHLVAMWFLWNGEVLLSPTNRRTRRAWLSRTRPPVPDETPAPDQAPGLEAAHGPEDLPPGNGQPFLEVDVTEHRAPSHQELASDGPRRTICQ